MAKNLASRIAGRFNTEHRISFSLDRRACLYKRPERGHRSGQIMRCHIPIVQYLATSGGAGGGASFKVTFTPTIASNGGAIVTARGSAEQNRPASQTPGAFPL